MISLFLSVILLLFVFDKEESMAQNRLKLQYALTVEEKHEDNIFLSEDKRRIGDFITRVMPTLKINYPMRTYKVSFDYTPQGIFYAQNKENNVLLHNMTTNGTFHYFRDTLTLSINDTLTLSPKDTRSLLVFGFDPVDPLSSSSSASVKDVPSNIYKDLTYVNIFSVSPQVTYRPNRLTDIEVGYGYSKTDYQDPFGVDADRNSAFITFREETEPNLNRGIIIPVFQNRLYSEFDK